jgi:bacterial leucyl aminopeptidase
MKKLGWILPLSLLTFSAFSAPSFITTDELAVKSISRAGIGIKKLTNTRGEAALYEIDDARIGHLTHLMHKELNRCGGFFFHSTKEKGLEFLRSDRSSLGTAGIFVDYEINQEDLVAQSLNSVSTINIQNTITDLSSFKNRYYNSDTGVDALKYLHNAWSKLSAGRSDTTVEFYNHKSWKQPSVVMTIKGHVSPDDIIILGGHADSIGGMFFAASLPAPGADDNASGVSTITEVIRVLMDSSYQPEKTIKFMAYAAEEVGLRGSGEIAKKFQAEKKNVLGVMQLDMTNFKGSSEDLILISDHTNEAQNKFLASIIDQYLGFTWAYDKCGYACSDHASWTAAGYPASFPFEAKFKDSNKKIHTANDTIAQSQGHAQNAGKFAKLALAYLIELDR